MKEIPLTQDKVALVDDEYFETLNKYKWCARKSRNSFYALRNTAGLNSKTVLMHRDVMKCNKNIKIDHRNGNGLDNQRSNLRICTVSQNGANSMRRKDNMVGLKGVGFNKHAGKFQARIKLNGKPIWLGLFINPVEAANAYDAAAIKHYGEFARTNFKEEL